MGIPNISRGSDSSGRVFSPPLSSATDPYVGSSPPLRTLAEPRRKSMSKAKQDDIPTFLFPLRPLSVTPVTPPRRPLHGKPATNGSVDVPCIGCTRIGTPAPPPIMTNGNMTPIRATTQGMERLNLWSSKGSVNNASETLNPRRLSFLMDRTEASRRSGDIETCPGNISQSTGDRERRRSRRASIGKALADFIDTADSNGAISDLASKVVKISNRISWSLDQRPSKRARLAAGFQ